MEELITGKKELRIRSLPLVAIPTTAGTGSEATHFATVYIKRIKHSLAHREFMMPDYSIIDPVLTLSLPKYQTACTGLDALCQGIESLWSNSATSESINYATQAVIYAYSNLENVVKSPNYNNRETMAKAANLSGKAINISKTTSAHSLSYPITSNFSIPHGHAVALSVPSFMLFNYSVTKKDITHPIGVEFVRSTIEKIMKIFNCSTPDEFRFKFTELMKKVGLKTKLSELGVPIDGLRIILQEGFTIERMGNNPRMVNKDHLRKILHGIW